MKEETRKKLELVESLCLADDQSIEYTIQYMMDFANVSHEYVMNYLYRNQPEKSV